MLAKVEVDYRSNLESHHICLLHDKLILYKAVFRHVKYVGLIIVPETLRRLIFNHYHAGPSGGHMGVYKTLFRIRMRFWWPGIRNDIKLWVKTCGQCVAYDVWRNRKSEMYFSWPVTTPFYIMHLDLWMPGKLVDNDGNTLQLLNCMCDLTQFVISILVSDARAEVLAKLFMEQVVFSFGMVAVVVVDADSKFLSVFKDMCEKLDFIFWPLARGNHKGNSVEKYHRFLNKTQTIVSAEVGTHHSFVENCKTSQYAWNSAPIDDTDIPRSLAAVGRHFKFPLDVKLSPNPTLNDEDQSALYIYLRDVSIDSNFASSVLQVLIEERRTAHRDRWNSNRAAKSFHVGDVVKAHVQVNSNLNKGVVGKLSYQGRGPFQIKEILEANSYLVQRYNYPDGPTRKYKGSELYLLPPSIFPANPVDTVDQRYLNFQNAPILSPLKRPLQIDLYNEKFFPENSKHISNPSKDNPSCTIDHATFLPHTLAPSMPTTDSLFDSIDAIPPSVEPSDNFPSPLPLPTDMNVSDKDLFFIQFTPSGTMRRKWYLIQIDIESTLELNPKYASNGELWCIFLARHPDDHKKSDEFSRWWPEWHRYTRCKTTNDIIYGDRILIRPTTIPCKDRFIQWSTLLSINGPDPVTLVGPFTFEPIDEYNRVRCKVHYDHWASLITTCAVHGILPPTVGAKVTHKITSCRPCTHKKSKKT